MSSAREAVAHEVPGLLVAPGSRAASPRFVLLLALAAISGVGAQTAPRARSSAARSTSARGVAPSPSYSRAVAARLAAWLLVAAPTRAEMARPLPSRLPRRKPLRESGKRRRVQLRGRRRHRAVHGHCHLSGGWRRRRWRLCHWRRCGAAGGLRAGGRQLRERLHNHFWRPRRHAKRGRCQRQRRVVQRRAACGCGVVQCVRGRRGRAGRLVRQRRLGGGRRGLGRGW